MDTKEIGKAIFNALIGILIAEIIFFLIRAGVYDYWGINIKAIYAVLAAPVGVVIGKIYSNWEKKNDEKFKKMEAVLEKLDSDKLDKAIFEQHKEQDKEFKEMLRDELKEIKSGQKLLIEKLIK